MNKLYVLVVLSLVLLSPVSLMGEVADSLEIKKAVVNNPAELLRGEISGVRVSATDGSLNGASSVFIRGLNTIRGDSQPLWIVDGIVVSNYTGITIPDYTGDSYAPARNNFAWIDPYEIESIEVLKDLSVTAKYGIQGANGVIIVKSRSAASGSHNIHFSSAAEVDFLPKVGEAFRNGFAHRYDIGVNGLMGSNSRYNISGFFKQHTGNVKDSDSHTGGLTFNYETKASDVFHFGMNTYLAYGQSSSTGGVNYIGLPSTMIVSRYPDAFFHDSVSGWLKDYDDDILDYRALNSMWLTIIILPNLHFKLSGDVDYQNQTRYLWFGEGTSFGARVDGISGIINNSLINYNGRGVLSYFKNINVKHHIEADLSLDLNGYLNRSNSMRGSSFDLPYLRSKGLSASKSNNDIRKFTNKNNVVGALAHIGYDYEGIAGLDASIRCDRNLRFDDKALWYPGLEAYLDLGKLFFSPNGAVSSLKLHAGFGVAGRENVVPYEWIGAYISPVPSILEGTERWYDGMNRLLSREYTFGTRALLLGGRLDLSANYFDKTTEDTFMTVNFGKSIDSLWMDAPHWTIKERRASTIHNSGLEIDLKAQIVRTDDIDWYLNCCATRHLNVSISLDSLDVLESRISGGLFRHTDFTRTVPKYYAGLGSAFRIRAFTFDMSFSAAGGFDIINANKTMETWKNVITEDCYEKGDYLRLDHIAVSYNVPLRAKWIRSFKVHLAAHNLFTLTGYSGWNPDVNCFGPSVRSYGVDYGSFPLSRSMVVGLSVNF